LVFALDQVDCGAWQLELPGNFTKHRLTEGLIDSTGGKRQDMPEF
jgi:hypothetical protein